MKGSNVVRVENIDSDDESELYKKFPNLMHIRYKYDRDTGRFLRYGFAEFGGNPIIGDFNFKGKIIHFTQMKRALPTREEIIQRNKKPNDTVKAIYEKIVLDVQNKLDDLKDGISYQDHVDDLDTEEIIQLFKIILDNPGYQILVFAKENRGYLPIPANILDWKDLPQFVDITDFKIKMNF